MAVSNAKKFIAKIQSDRNFRKTLYDFESPSEIHEYLNSEGLVFTEDEFEDSYRNLLVNCQFQEDADILTDTVNMCRFLLTV